MAIGLSIVALGNKKVQDLKNSCTEAVGGTCISCELQSRTIRRNRNRNYYLITASYKVNGVTYTAKGRSDRPYEQRDDISVHYDPSDPSRSYTGSAPAPANDSMPIIAVVCMTPIIVVIVLFKHSNRFT